jgi:hypothetical protein
LEKERGGFKHQAEGIERIERRRVVNYKVEEKDRKAKDNTLTA